MSDDVTARLAEALWPGAPRPPRRGDAARTLARLLPVVRELMAEAAAEEQRETCRFEAVCSLCRYFASDDR